MSGAEASFSQDHHACLFAWLAREVVALAGAQDGEAAVRRAIRRYGQERGGRMAARCQANRHALSMLNFFAYGEWQVEKGQMVSKLSRQGADARVLTVQCPWHGAWQANQLLPYGRLYCLDIDEAVLAGFSPDLRMSVASTLSNGDTRCEFLFHAANLSLPKLLLILYRRSVRPGKRAIMPWAYHTGHLYSTMADALVKELGLAGQRAVDAAMEEFTARYGQPARVAVEAYRGTDFTAVPL